MVLKWFRGGSGAGFVIADPTFSMPGYEVVLKWFRNGSEVVFARPEMVLKWFSMVLDVNSSQNTAQHIIFLPI